jgi:hypothetical protein
MVVVLIKVVLLMRMLSLTFGCRRRVVSASEQQQLVSRLVLFLSSARAEHGDRELCDYLHQHISRPAGMPAAVDAQGGGCSFVRWVVVAAFNRGIDYLKSRRREPMCASQRLL